MSEKKRNCDTCAKKAVCKYVEKFSKLWAAAEDLHSDEVPFLLTATCTEYREDSLQRKPLSSRADSVSGRYSAYTGGGDFRDCAEARR